MNPKQQRNYWVRTPRPARPALIATAVLLIVGIGTFVVVTILASVSLGISPGQAIFGPVPGNPVITWLYFVLPALVIQGAVALALRHPANAPRIIGTVGAFVIAGFCLFWLAAVAYDVVRWLTTGTLPGDSGDLMVVAFFGVPFALVMGGLNAWAGVLSVLVLRGPGHAGPIGGLGNPRSERGCRVPPCHTEP